MPRLRQVAFAVVSLSLLASSTSAVASATPAPSTDPWLAFSMLNTSGAAMLGTAPTAAVCGAAAAAAAQPGGGCVLPQVGVVPAAQPAGPPPPPPQFVGPATPPLPVVLVWLAVIGLDIYLLARNDHNGRGNSPT
jgi:hypothetical protein